MPDTRILAGAALAAALIPARLQPHAQAEPAAPAQVPSTRAATTAAAGPVRTAAPTPVRTYCDVAAPPVHPRHEG